MLLTKGIDNCLLTSFRTLNKKNNLISDTFKIIHNKFAPVRGQANAYFAASKRLTEVERTGALNPPLDLSHMCTREGGPFDPTTAFIQPPTTKPAAPVRKNQQSSVMMDCSISGQPVTAA